MRLPDFRAAALAARSARFHQLPTLARESMALTSLNKPGAVRPTAASTQRDKRNRYRLEWARSAYKDMVYFNQVRHLCSTTRRN